METSQSLSNAAKVDATPLGSGKARFLMTDEEFSERVKQIRDSLAEVVLKAIYVRLFEKPGRRDMTERQKEADDVLRAADSLLHDDVRTRGSLDLWRTLQKRPTTT